MYFPIVGRYQVNVQYDGAEIKNSPYFVNVYDVSYARIIQLQRSPIPVGTEYRFQGIYLYRYHLYSLDNRTIW